MDPFGKRVPEIEDIEDIQEKLEKYPLSTERNFTKYYHVEFSKQDFYLDTCISMHSNKTCLVFLAEGHSIIKDKKTIQKLEFQIGKVNRLSNLASGKRKRNAQVLNKNSVLCFIETTDGMRYPLCAGINAKLLDVNRAVVSNPEKLIEGHKSTGYLAMLIAQDYRKTPQEICKNCLTSEEYKAVLANRNSQ